MSSDICIWCGHPELHHKGAVGAPATEGEESANAAWHAYKRGWEGK